jgi:hypothetical protein
MARKNKSVLLTYWSLWQKQTHNEKLQNFLHSTTQFLSRAIAWRRFNTCIAVRVKRAHTEREENSFVFAIYMRKLLQKGLKSLHVYAYKKILSRERKELQAVVARRHCIRKFLRSLQRA